MVRATISRKDLMTDLAAPPQSPDDIGEKGLKGGALGLISSVVVGVASTAPAYSLAATLGFVVIAINGLQAPIITILAFVPMLFISYGYKEMNYADPDCGTTFTWGARAFGPKTGWMGGWGIVAADLLVMASLAQIAGQYVFLLFNANGDRDNASSGWVLLVGILWIVAMTAICYVGIEISANFQKALLGIELTMLLVLSIVALVKVGNGTAPVGHLTPSCRGSTRSHFTFSGFMVGFTLMLFIYWGWDTAVSVNEETKDSQTTPGRAAVLSTLVLLATYALVILATQSYAGIGTKGIGLENPNRATCSRSSGTPSSAPRASPTSCPTCSSSWCSARPPPRPRPRSCPPPAPRCPWPSTRPSPRLRQGSTRGTSRRRCRRWPWAASRSSSTW
jgi:hypothetical protein